MRDPGLGEGVEGVAATDDGMHDWGGVGGGGGCGAELSSFINVALSRGVVDSEVSSCVRSSPTGLRDAN